MDLSHWDIRQTFTKREAAFLITGYDPYLKDVEPAVQARIKFYKDEIGNSFTKSYTLAFSVARYMGQRDVPSDLGPDIWSDEAQERGEAFRINGDVGPDFWTTDYVNLVNERPIHLPSAELRESVERVFNNPVSYPLILRSDEWYEEHFSRADLAAWIDGVGLKSKYDFSPARANDGGAQLPLARDFHSGELTLLVQAAEKFWKNVARDEPATYPKNQDIADWLIKQSSAYSPTLAEKAASIIRPRWAGKGGRPPEK